MSNEGRTDRAVEPSRARSPNRNPCNSLLLGGPGPELVGECGEGLKAEDDDAGDQRRAGRGGYRRVAHGRRTRRGRNQQERKHDCPDVGLGVLGLAVQAIGDAAQSCDRRHRNGHQQRVERKRVSAVLIGEHSAEDEGEREKSARHIGRVRRVTLDSCVSRYAREVNGGG